MYWWLQTVCSLYLDNFYYTRAYVFRLVDLCSKEITKLCTGVCSMFGVCILKIHRYVPVLVG